MANISKLRQEYPPRLTEEGILQYYCVECLNYKNFDLFVSKSGRCKPCRTEYYKKYRVKNKDKLDMYNASYAPQYHRKKKYRISEEHFQGLLLLQEGRCKLCMRLPEEVSTRGVLTVDHDHETQKIRGLLCHICNSALGMFQDNPELLKRAIKYLQGELS